MKLDEKNTNKIINILDNLLYWETCPEEYKEEIPLLIRALNMHIVGGSLPEEKELVSEMDKNWKRISNDIPNLNKVTFYISFRTCYRWLKNELK